MLSINPRFILVAVCDSSSCKQNRLNRIYRHGFSVSLYDYSAEISKARLPFDLFQCETFGVDRAFYFIHVRKPSWKFNVRNVGSFISGYNYE